MSKQILRLVGGGMAILGAAILVFAVYSFISQQQLEARLEAQVPGANPIATSTLAAFAVPSETPAAAVTADGSNPVSPSVTPFPTHATPVQPDATLAASLVGTPTAISLNPNAPTAAANSTGPIASQTVTRATSVAAANIVKPTGVPRGSGSPATRLKIPRLGLDTAVEEANFVTYQQNGQLVSDWNVPYHAAGHLLNSAQPGEVGNAIFSGHHNLTAPNTFGLGLFAGLWNLTVGDEIEIATKNNKTLIWRVTDSFPVKEGGEPLSVRIMHAQQIMSDTAKPTITLLTCWNGQTNPLSGNLYRWVIHAELVAETKGTHDIMAFTLDEILSRGVAEIITEAELRKRLDEGKPLRLKMGFDPSRPLLTIGNMVGIRKLRQFQELGHQVVLIVGDWTAQIGDPSGKDETRKMLSYDETQANARTFMDQFFKVVDKDKTEVRWQSEWFGKFKLDDVFHLAKTFTLADMMEHETFAKRWREGQPLTMIELLYPALQAYDSIAIDADVEFGGMDQKFNILAGRQLQERRGKRPQQVFLVPLLPGTDGRVKMGKSLGNTIDVYDSPNDTFGKVMSLADSVLPIYLTVASNLPDAEVNAYKEQLAAGSVNPRDIKMKLAYDIVSQFHGTAAAQSAEQEFIKVFSKRELPTDMDTFAMHAPMPVIELLVAANFASSKGEARRLVQQGGVKLNEEKISEIDAVIPAAEGILSVGRRKFVRLSGEA